MADAFIGHRSDENRKEEQKAKEEEEEEEDGHGDGSINEDAIT